jgi:hypothetical protein
MIMLFSRGDLAYFDGINETILSAALVKPKQGKMKFSVCYMCQVSTNDFYYLLSSNNSF